MKLILNYLIFSVVWLLSVNANIYAGELKILAGNALLDDDKLTLTLKSDVKIELKEIIIKTSEVIIYLDNKYQPLKLLAANKVDIFNTKYQSTIIADSAIYNFITKQLKLNGNVNYTSFDDFISIMGIK